MKISVQNICFFIVAAVFLSCSRSERLPGLAVSRPAKEKPRIVKVNAGETTRRIDSLFTDLVKTRNYNGGLLVARNGLIVYENVYGYSNYERRDSLHIHSRFQIASVSKSFTALAVVMLHERGLLNYTDSIQQFFPDFPYSGITVWHLLTHRSGLGNYMYFCETLTDRRTPITNRDVLRLMVEHRPKPYMKPDVQFDYCNTNYALLALIVEKVSGQPFAAFVKENIFEPAGMKRSFIFDKTKENPHEAVSTGYHFPWLEAYHTYQDGVVGDKGIYTTLEDLFRFDQALYSELLVKKESRALIFSPANPDLEHTNYGFGWRLRQLDNETQMVFHTGWWRGFNSLLLRIPEKRITIIMLANKRTRGSMRLYKKIANVLAPELFPQIWLTADSVQAVATSDSTDL